MRGGAAPPPSLTEGAAAPLRGLRGGRDRVRVLEGSGGVPVGPSTCGSVPVEGLRGAPAATRALPSIFFVPPRPAGRWLEGKKKIKNKNKTSIFRFAAAPPSLEGAARPAQVPSWRHGDKF